MTITTANCPSCGGQVTFARGASIVVVCEFCGSAVARTDRDVRDLGKVAALIETGSPLELGRLGRYDGRPFVLTGRAQLGHEAGGVWDEWYATFADGSTGWLAEAQGRFFMTSRVDVPDPRVIPPLASLRPGTAGVLPGAPNRFVVGEVGEARALSGEGEIPWKLAPGDTYYYADLSGDNGAFATIDFGEAVPALYIGREVTLDDLAIRVDADALSARQKRVGAVRLTCPSCGGPVEVRAPESERATCPNCNALLDISRGNLSYLKTLRQRVRPLIPLGSKGRFAEGELVVVGFMTRYVVFDKRYTWEEYLLYDPGLGFRWLVHDSGHWSYVVPISAGDVFDGGTVANYRGRQYKLFNSAQAFVDAVYGEFYWRVEEGETVRAQDFVNPPEIVSKEVSGTEVNWSHGTYLPRAEVGRIFNLEKLPRASTVGMAEPNPHVGYLMPWVAMLMLGLIAGIVTFWIAPRREVLAERFAFEALASAQATEVAFSEPFELRGGENIRIQTRAPVSNSWAYLEGDLVNEETGLVQAFSAPMEYYHGTSDGESWSEGSDTYVTHLSALPAGRYSLRLEAQWEKWQAPMTISISIKQGVPRVLYFGIMMGVLAAFPIVTLVRRQSFETRRWAESSVAT